MIPPEFAEALKGVSLFEFVAVIAVAIVAAWVVIKFVVWLFKKFFPGVVASAQAVVNGAKIFASVNGLPAFIARTDATLDTQNATLERHSQTLERQDERIAEIHHETHTNNGSSIKDAVVRTEEVVNTQILPALKVLTGDNKVLHEDNAKLRKDFEETQASEIHLTVSPKATVTEES